MADSTNDSNMTVDQVAGKELRDRVKEFLQALEHSAGELSVNSFLERVPESQREALRPGLEALALVFRASPSTGTSDQDSPLATGLHTMSYLANDAVADRAKRDTRGPSMERDIETSRISPQRPDETVSTDQNPDFSYERGVTAELPTATGVPGPAPKSSNRISASGPTSSRQRAISIPGHEVIEELGRGGMGVVYKARHLKLNRLVAVKLMLVAEEPGSSGRDRFDAEARAVARMQHPNIVQLYEMGEVNGLPYFSLEFVDGGTLARKVSQQLLSPRESAQLMLTLARSVDYAHRMGIVHRDLKPANILISPDGTPKIADFGLAKPIDNTDSGLTRDGTVVGTPSYMPPEQARGDVDLIGPYSDVYALGAILYDLLTGRPPFKGSTVLDTLEQVRTREPLPPTSIQGNLPRDLETICLKCLQKEPEKRYATSGELGDDLQRFINGEPILARPISSVERAWRWCKRNQRVAALLALVIGLLTLLAGGSTAAAVIIDKDRETIANQNVEIKEKNDVITEQLDQVTKAEMKAVAALQIAKDRLETYRNAVEKFVNEAPQLLDGYPLASQPNQELLRLSLGLMEESQGKAADAEIAERGQLAVLLRRANLAQTEGKLDEAVKQFAEAQTLAEKLSRPGAPERDKGAGNLAAILNQQALIHHTRGRGLAGRDPEAARREYQEALRLVSEALKLQERVLKEPDTKEISPGEALTWLASSHYAIAQVQQSLAGLAGSPEERKAALLAARDAAKLAETNYAKGLETGRFSPSAMNNSRMTQALCAFQQAVTLEQLEDYKAAGEAYQRAFDGLSGLAKKQPGNLKYQQNLSTIAAQFGDLLLIYDNDSKKAEQMYLQAVIALSRLAQPPELELAERTLALDYYRLATANRKNGDEANAMRRYGVCVELREEQLRLAERRAAASKQKDPPYLVSAQISAMLAQARFGKHLDATRMARDLVTRFASDPTRLSYAAAGLALSAEAARDDDEATSKQYRDEAFRVLGVAIDRGYKDLKFLEHDPDLDSLRDDPRFRPLVEKVRAGQKS